MIVIYRTLSGSRRECYRRLARWRLAPHKYIGKCGAAHRAGMETVDYSVGKRGLIAYRQGTAGHHDHHQRLACSLELFHQTALRTYEADFSHRVTLAGKYGVFTNGNDYHVSTVGSRYCFGYACFVGATRGKQSGAINQLDILFFKCVAQRHGVLFLSVENPCAKLVIACVGHRAGEQHALGSL